MPKSNAVKFVHYGGPKDGKVGKAFTSVSELNVKSADPNDTSEYKYKRKSRRRFNFVGICKGKTKA